MATEQYVVRPVWQVVSIQSDGREIVVDTVPDEGVANTRAESLSRQSARLDRVAQSIPQNRRDRER